jgi:hypothetical protein
MDYASALVAAFFIGGLGGLTVLLVIHVTTQRRRKRSNMQWDDAMRDWDAAMAAWRAAEPPVEAPAIRPPPPPSSGLAMTQAAAAWENEARRYAKNADYWRERAEQAEGKDASGQVS